MDKNIRFSISHLDAVLPKYLIGCNGVQMVRIHMPINLSSWPA